MYSVLHCCIKVQKLWLFIIWMVRLKMNRLMQKSCDWFNNYYNFEYCIEQDSAVCGGQPVLSIHRKHQLVARQPERQMSVSDVKERLHYGRKSSKSKKWSENMKFYIKLCNCTLMMCNFDDVNVESNHNQYLPLHVFIYNILSWHTVKHV